MQSVCVCVCERDCMFSVCVCRRVSSSSCLLISSSVFSAELFHERAERMFSWIYCYYTSLSSPLLSSSRLHSCPLSPLSTLSSLSLSRSHFSWLKTHLALAQGAVCSCELTGSIHTPESWHSEQSHTVNIFIVTLLRALKAARSEFSTLEAKSKEKTNSPRSSCNKPTH